MLFTTVDGMALDVFRAVDTFGRIASDGAGRVHGTVAAALNGTLDVRAGVEERRRNYPRPAHPRGATEVAFDETSSDLATVIEVHTDDQVGVLYRLAETLAECGLDVSVAKVATLADRVVDAFYVTEDGAKLAASRRESVRLRIIEAMA
jgi:[protein-PII] uridylyltransferase